MVPKHPEEHRILLLTEKTVTSPKSSHSANRVDKIQGLRAIAIIGVLLFHIKSDLFGNGYLGVDVFFVISGYLMCMLLSRHSKLDCHKVADFYYRRIQKNHSYLLIYHFCF
ncbi:Acyl-transf-3 domain-containing protein [Aphelenchoides bicaudatus]|nr:Acyl-transf-3 domain-containing protein [Aphelenchoides bicaudatus]